MTSKTLAGLAVLSLCGSAVASPASDMWDANASDLTNLSAMAYTDVTTVGPDWDSSTGMYIVRNTGRWGIGDASISSSTGTAYADVAYGKLRSSASAISTPTDFGNASFKTEWRDVLNITGGTGTGTLVISGHAEGKMSGYSDSMGIGARLTSIGSFGRWDSLVGGTFVNAYDHLYSSSTPNCGGVYSSDCTISIIGNSLRFDFTLTAPFEYGGNVFLFSNISGAAGSDYRQPSSLIDFLNTSAIDTILAPAGAQVTSAAGTLILRNGTYVYAAVVPEPATFLLAFCGLLALAGAIRLRR